MTYLQSPVRIDQRERTTRTSIGVKFVVCFLLSKSEAFSILVGYRIVAVGSSSSPCTIKKTSCFYFYYSGTRYERLSLGIRFDLTLLFSPVSWGLRFFSLILPTPLFFLSFAFRNM